MFWALRGGGGGTYGIVTSTTYQTHPIFPLTAAFLNATFTSPAIAQNVTTEFIKLHPTISDAGWGGYITLDNSSLSMILAAPNISWADTNTMFLPFAQYVAEATSGSVHVMTEPFTSFYELYLTLIANQDGLVGTAVEIASRLLPRSIAEADPAKAARIMLSLEGGVGLK